MRNSWRLVAGAVIVVVGPVSTAAAAGDGWTPPEVVSTAGVDTSNTNPGQAVAVAPDGTAATVWVQTASSEVWAARRSPASTGWQPPVRLSTPGTVADAPVVAFLADGREVALWTEDSGGGSVVVASTADASGAWSGATVVSDPGTVAITPDIAVNPDDGGAMIVWQEQVDTYSFAWISKTLGADGWERRATHDTTTGLGVRSLVATGSGTYAIEYMDQVGDHNELFVSRYDGSTWGPRETLAASQLTPAGLATTDGTLVTAWVEVDGDRSGRVVVAVDGADGWTQRVIASPAAPSSSTAIDFDLQGNLVLVWAQGITESGFPLDYQTWASTSPDGLTWSEATQVSSTPDVQYVTVGSASNGSAIAVWGTNRNEAYSSTLVDGTWSPEEALAGYTPCSGLPALAVNDGGSSAAVWGAPSGVGDVTASSPQAVVESRWGALGEVPIPSSTTSTTVSPSFSGAVAVVPSFTC